MMQRATVRARLFLVLALLVLATVVVGATSWVSLRQASGRLDLLHNETLAAVDRALTLSSLASDLATRAPWLLTLDSPFRIKQDAEASRRLIAAIADTLPPLDQGLAATLTEMDQSILALITAATSRGELADQIMRLNAQLSHAERRFAALAGTGRVALPEAQDWITLQRITAALIGAGRAQGLVAVGEFQREYHRQITRLAPRLNGLAASDLNGLRRLAEGPEGLFEARRLQSARQIEAEAALTRIRRGTEAVRLWAAEVTTQAEAQIAAERASTVSAIAFAKGVILTVALISMLVALFAALFVSGYVTANLRAISDAMMRLAVGDRTSRLPRGEHAGDEIGKLFHAFRAFRANTLRLDRSHRQLAQRNALFQNLYDGISDGLAILSDRGTLIAANSRLAAVLRVEPAALARGTDMAELLARSGWQREASALEGGGFEELHHPDGGVVELRESQLATGGAVMLLSDASERRALETRLARIQRTEALGKIAGEVAHDFGNILSTISTSLHLLETAPPERVVSLRQSLSATLDLGTSLTQRLLAFARRMHLEPEVMDLNALAEGVEDLIALALDERISLSITPAAVPLHVRIDPGQMESALLNLCLNAAQAIEGDGNICIALALTADNHAQITVTDTGMGMSAEVLAHATEPFFTARKDGTGTGLGLPTVYGFIRQSGGDVQISSRPGHGTAVTLLLPLCAPASVAATLPLPCYGRVLLVEDNPTDAARARALLAASQVIEAASPEAALALLEHADPFDLVITDLHFGFEAAGWRIAEAALNRAPTTRCVVVSGRLPPQDPLTHRFPGRAFRLAKPLEPAALAELLQGQDFI